MIDTTNLALSAIFQKQGSLIFIFLEGIIHAIKMQGMVYHLLPVYSHEKTLGMNIRDWITKHLKLQNSLVSVY